MKNPARVSRLLRKIVAATSMASIGLVACSSPAERRNTHSSQPSDSSAPSNTLPAVMVASATTDPAPRIGGPVIIRVPADHRSIQAAVDAALPGDLVLIAAGTYHEAVKVHVPRIVVRGEDRNTVILDGQDQLENGFLVAADGVAVENLTVQRYQVNGIIFTKAYDDVVTDPSQHQILKGYRASYVTTANNGLYGLYAFFARGGQFDHSYASGHPDSGVYIGQCKPCDAMVTDMVVESNSVGYEGTNASGNLYVINSIWRRNRVGITPNSQDMEKLAPQGDVVVAGNLVVDNNEANSPSTGGGAFGLGIAIGGGTSNQVVRNRVTGNRTAGIVITDLNHYQPAGNQVKANVVQGNGIDLGYYLSTGPIITAMGNCFFGNTFTTSGPDAIETAMPCGGAPAAGGPQMASDPVRFAVEEPPGVDYRSIALPGPQPSMANALNAPARSAEDRRPNIDVNTIMLPAP